ncbi:MAG TPA: DEAD/DEAH box helicase, partial [Isosphaeraceae bacterium]|nr:DEAD/DEAH box helicase [Isosphaeraceae bacterium]
MPKTRKLVPPKAKAPSKLETSKAPASSGVPSKSRASEVGAVKATLQDILGPAGALARKLPGYEARPQQLAMAEAVAHAIGTQTHLLVEAGTGTGKSLAYLVPSILAALEMGKRVAVATHTLALQAQLLEKDLPLLKEVMPGRFTAVKVMGRSNYLSLRRLRNAVGDRELLFGAGEDRDQLAMIASLADGLTEGAFSELGFDPKWFIRQEVESDRHDCLGKECPTHSRCFYYRAKARASGAEVVVVNHSLLIIDLMLRAKGAPGILPPYDVLIVDEAHTLEQVASGLLGITVTSGQVDHLLNRISREPRGPDRPAAGLLATSAIEGGIAAVGRARVISEEFFMEIASWRAKDLGGSGRVSGPRTKPGAFALVEALKKLASTLFAGVSHRGVKSLEADLDDEANDDDAGEDRIPELELKFVAAARRCREIAKDLESWLQQSLSQPSVYWVEVR